MRNLICGWLAKKAFNYIGHFMDYSNLQTNDPRWNTLCAARSILLAYPDSV